MLFALKKGKTRRSAFHTINEHSCPLPSLKISVGGIWGLWRGKLTARTSVYRAAGSAQGRLEELSAGLPLRISRRHLLFIMWLLSATFMRSKRKFLSYCQMASTWSDEMMLKPSQKRKRTHLGQDSWASSEKTWNPSICKSRVKT